MAFQSHRTRFQGNLAGIKQEKIIELDYSKENINDRMDFIKGKHDALRPFFDEYVDEYYKVNVNTNDNLSADINIFKAIEKDANYLLNSTDVARDKQYSYNLLSQEEFDKAIKKENKTDLYQEDIMDVLRPDSKNDYINMDLKITQRDLDENTEFGRIVREYQATRVHLKDEMNNLKLGEGSYLKLYQIKNLLGSINGDMLDCKKSYKGVTRPSTKLGDIGGEIDYTCADYTDPEQIKDIIKSFRFGQIHPDSIKSHLAYDIEYAVKKLYKKGRLDKLDLEIVDCLNSGYSERRTGKELNRDKKAISQRLDKIARRISDFYTYFIIDKN